MQTFILADLAFIVILPNLSQVYCRYNFQTIKKEKYKQMLNKLAQTSSMKEVSHNWTKVGQESFHKSS
jgi:hypothetical protein